MAASSAAAPMAASSANHPPAASSSADAFRSFLFENRVQDTTTPALFQYDDGDSLYRVAPWRKEAKFFKRVRISAVALVKMTMHAHSGGDIEVMGLMQGKATENGEFVVLDAFPLPVEGTETRVNAGAGANEFMCMYKDLSDQVNKRENIVGWYHSHPGYRPWLSGIDVSTQRLYQQHQEPFLAVVIDPIRTSVSGKVDIGAFRTLPEGAGGNGGAGETQQGAARRVVGSSLPAEKIADFGVHANEYYQIPISYFKSAMDDEVLSLLWSRYWVETLSACPLINSNAGQLNRSLASVCDKLRGCRCLLAVAGGGGGVPPMGAGGVPGGVSSSLGTSAATTGKRDGGSDQWGSASMGALPMGGGAMW